MAYIVKPRVIFVAETKVNEAGLKDLLNAVGAPDWTTNAASDADLLTEVAGRLCYKSFEVGLNPNITKVREGNGVYLENVLSQKHGSVFEHAHVTFAFMNVSRILTHEQVRHRHNNYSQESLRYVRFDNIGMYMPDAFDWEFLDKIPQHVSESWRQAVDEGDTASTWAQEMEKSLKEGFMGIASFAEHWISSQAEKLFLNHPKVPFHIKKAVTSALRRAAPAGMTTNILVTGNHRAWRYEIEARTSDGAEEEIRKVFKDVALFMEERYPATYQDMTVLPGGVVQFTNQKV